MIPLSKIERAAGIVFRNALRLHKDSVLLCKNGSYSSAYQLSILAQEEIGKALFLEEVVWQARPDHDKEINDPEYEKIINNCFYSHKVKQGWFSRHADDFELYTGKSKGPKYLKGLRDGTFDQRKQKATYVGLPKINNALDWQKRISVPNISKKEAEFQVTRVNDYLVNLIEGCRRETNFVDTDSLDRQLTMELAKELENAWPSKSFRRRKELERIRKFPVVKYD